MADAKFYRSTFGGGWLIPATRRGKQAFSRYFGESAADLYGLGRGYIIEPHDVQGLADFARQEGLHVKDRSAGR